MGKLIQSINFFRANSQNIKKDYSAFKMSTNATRGKKYFGRPMHKWQGYIRANKEKDVNTRNWID